MYHLFRSCSTFNCPENFPKLQTIRWVFVMLPSLSIGLTSKYWKLGCQPSKTVRLICSKFVRSKKNKHIVLCMVFFWGRDTLKSTLIKTRLSLTSRMWKRSFENGVTTFWVQGQAKSMIMTCHRQVCGKKGKFKLIDQIRFPTSCLSVSNDFQYPTTSGLLFYMLVLGAVFQASRSEMVFLLRFMDVMLPGSVSPCCFTVSFQNGSRIHNPQKWVHGPISQKIVIGTNPHSSRKIICQNRFRKPSTSGLALLFPKKWVLR